MEATPAIMLGINSDSQSWRILFSMWTQFIRMFSSYRMSLNIPYYGSGKIKLEVTITEDKHEFTFILILPAFHIRRLPPCYIHPCTLSGRNFCIYLRDGIPWRNITISFFISRPKSNYYEISFTEENVHAPVICVEGKAILWLYY